MNQFKDLFRKYSQFENQNISCLNCSKLILSWHRDLQLILFISLLGLGILGPIVLRGDTFALLSSQALASPWSLMGFLAGLSFTFALMNNHAVASFRGHILRFTLVLFTVTSRAIVGQSIIFFFSYWMLDDLGTMLDNLDIMLGSLDIMLGSLDTMLGTMLGSLDTMLGTMLDTMLDSGGLGGV
jgi:hypothetical protein